MGLLFALQAIPALTPGDTRLTQEGNFYRLFLFDANHQCRSTISYFQEGTAPRVEERQTDWAGVRCDPYTYWFRIRHQCRALDPVRVSWTLDHSVDGGPFYRIVDEQDACALHYRAVGHNPWIRLPEDGAAIVGQAIKNYYRPGEGPPPATPDPESPSLGRLQQALAPHVGVLRVALWILWLGTLVIAVIRGLVLPALRRRASCRTRAGSDTVT